MSELLGDTTDEPRCIAWLVRGDEGYGVRRAVVSLVAAVAQRGHRPIVLCLESEGSLGRACAAAGAAVVALHGDAPPALAGSVWSKAKAWRALRRYERVALPRVVKALREHEAAVVHVLWPNLMGLGASAARRVGARCVWEMPNVLGQSGPAVLSRGFYQWRCWCGGVTVLANSAYTAASLGHWPVRPRVVHLGADAGRFDPARVQPMSRAALGIPADAAVFGIVARLDPSKGQARVLQALIELGEMARDAHLLLVGGASDADEPARLQSLAAQAGVADRLHLVGEVDEPERYYGAIDVAINSRVDAEPFGLSVIEAMLMARPVAVHALGGPVETVTDGRTGWHVQDPSVAGWAEALRRILAERDRWPMLGKAAQAHARERYTSAAHVQRYLAALDGG